MDSFFILQILQNFFIRVEKKMQTKLICYESSEKSVNTTIIPEISVISLKINTNLIPFTVHGQTWYECYDKKNYDKTIYLKRAENYTKY